MLDRLLRPRLAIYLAMIIVSLTTLALELLLARIISAMAYYHLSFFVVSLALLGMTGGAVLVYVFSDFFVPERALPRCADLFSLSIPLGVTAILAIPLPSAMNLTAVAALTLSALVTCVPFLLSGVLVSLTLTRCGLAYGRIYAADLVGAAVGAELLVVGLNLLEPGTLTCLLGLLAAAAASAYRRFFGQRAPRAGAMWMLLLVTVGVITEATSGGIVLVHSKGRTFDPAGLQFVRWNNHSYVTVERFHTGPPFLWGPGSKMPGRVVEQAYLSIDGGAGTHLTRFTGDLDKVRWLFWDVTSLAYQLVEPKRVAVIGVGGGRDALAALVAGADRVDAIDVNGIIINLLSGRADPAIGDFIGLADDPRIVLVHDDARNFLSTAPHQFDVIQMSLIDTWAASSAGAYALTENGLYTLEAWRIFADRLADNGMLTVSRWFATSGLDETTRSLAMAVALCLDRNLRPNDHLILATSGRVANMIWSPTPLSDERRRRLQEVCAERGFQLALAPGVEPEHPVHRALLGCRTRAQLDAVCLASPLDISPATDDQPYFFNQLKPWRLSVWLRPELHFGGAIGNLKATFTLLIALAIAAMGLAFGVVWPLAQVPVPSDLPPWRLAALLVYFAGIGLGFMFVEIAFVQRFSLLLGHPAYALALVVASMVFAGGLGSLAADRLPVERPFTFLAYPIVIVVVLALARVIFPAAAEAAMTQSWTVRAVTALAFTVPAGLVMGVCFPLGMVQVHRLANSLAPWMWGINGATSVLGTILAVLISLSAGISVTLGAAIGCYTLVLACNVVLLANRPVSTCPGTHP
jgi:hypothetical protein